MSEASHIHTDAIIIDSDVHFTIDTTTRVISNRNADKVNEKLVLTQYDNKSERYSFDIDRYVESHDLLSCNRVQVHYINIGSNKQQNVGVYLVDDVHINESNNNKISFSWLITQNATMLDGVLSFLVSFECVNGETVLYRWSTTTYDAIQIVVGLDNGGAVIEQCADELLAWQIKMENEYLPSLVDDCYLEVNFATSEEVARVFDMYSSDEISSIIGIDDIPTDNSKNLVRSGGVKTYVDDIKQSYLKNASVLNDVLVITKQDGSSITFEGGSGSGSGDGSGNDNSKANIDASNLSTDNKNSWISALGINSKANQSDLNKLNSTAERLDNDIEVLNNSISSLNTNKANLDATNLSTEDKNSWITALGVDSKANNDEVNSLLDNKVDKVSDKGLSTNDLTNELLQEIQDGLIKELTSPVLIQTTKAGIYRIPKDCQLKYGSITTIPSEAYLFIVDTAENRKDFYVSYNNHPSGEPVKHYIGFGWAGFDPAYPEIELGGGGGYKDFELSVLEDCVDLSTDQLIGGQKTFGVAPKISPTLNTNFSDNTLVPASWVNDKVNKKQDALTAGNNITITDGIISAELSGSAPIILLESPVRIWNLDSGIYKVPAGATIYYYGASNTASTLPYNNANSAIMIVNNNVEGTSSFKSFVLFANLTQNTQRGFIIGSTTEYSGSYVFNQEFTGSATKDGAGNIITDTYLKKTGGTLTGQLVNDSSVRYNMSFIDQYNNPSSTQYKVSDWFYDKNNKVVGVRQLAQFNNGKIEQKIDVRRDINNNGTTSYAELIIGMEANGTSYAKAPNPASNSNTNDIATTKWVRERSDTYLPLTGGTMSGSIKMTDGQSYIQNSSGNSMLGDAGTYMFVGNPTDPLQLRGKNTRPTYYNGSVNPQMALLTDLDNYLKLDGSNYYAKLSEPSDNGNVAGWRRVASYTVGKWAYGYLSLAIKSRHSGTGLLTIGICDTNGGIETVDASIRFYGSTDSIMYTDAWKMIYNKTTGATNVYWKFKDYNSCEIKVLGLNGFTCHWNNGEWLTTEPKAGENEIEYLPVIYNEEVVTIYDKQSNDASINLGMTSGIQGSKSITYDFSPYKKLKVYIFAYAVMFTGIIDLEFSKSGDYIITPLAQSEEQYNQVDKAPATYFAGISVANNKQSLLNKTMGYFYNTQYTLRNSNASYYIYKIEGVK